MLKKKFFNTSHALALFFIFTLSFINQKTFSQSCNCDITIPISQTLIDGANNSILPGKVICLTAGTRKQLKIRNLTGTAANPIIIKNCGGVVNISASYGYGIWVENSKYFKISGTGSSDKYGINVTTQDLNGSVGVKLWLKSTNFEIDHLEVHHTGFCAIEAKSDPKCDLSTNRGNFTMYDLSFHDNYIHNAGAEGMYVGFSFPNGYSNNSGCKGTVLYPHNIVGCKIYNNKVINSDADGIQVSCVTSGFEMYNNEIINYGVNPFAAYQNSGIMIGGLTNGPIYNNLVQNGPGNGININGGSGSNLVYNNVIVNAGDMGIFVDELPGIANNGGGYKFINNTIINAGIDGIRLNTELTPNNQVKNNIIINPGSGVFTRKQANVSVAESNNYYSNLISNVNFVNASTGNYTILNSSPAVNTGTNVSTLGIIKDKDGNARPSGSAYDIGAFEYQTSVQQNILPMVNVGIDKILNLPINSIQLIGNASDSDGIISNYLWTKESGGTASLTNINTSTLQLSNLNVGIYLFKLTVTDNQGGTAFDEVSVSVINAINQTPIVNAGLDKTIVLPINSIILNGSAIDNDGSISSYNWTKQSGGNATLLNQNSAILSITNLLAGSYIFRLNATDNLGLISFDEVNVNVINSSFNISPTVNAGVDQILVLPVRSTTLIGTASDPDGTITNYLWKKLSGSGGTFSNLNSQTLQLSNLNSGIYNFRLTVTDNSGAKSFNDVLVTVLASKNAFDNPPIENQKTSNPINTLRKEKLILFPNPANEEISIIIENLETQFFSIKLFDISGKLVFSKENISGNTYQIERNNLKSGIYIISIQFETTLLNEKLIFE